MNHVLRYAFEDLLRRQFSDAFVGATEVTTDLSAVVGLRKVAWGGKVYSEAVFVFLKLKFHQHQC